MAVSTAQVPLTGLARKLVMDGLLEEDAASQAWDESLSDKTPFVSHVVSKGLVNAAAIAQIAAEEFGVPVMDLDCVEIDRDVTKAVQEKIIRDHQTLPIFRRGNRLFIAVADPTNAHADPCGVASISTESRVESSTSDPRSTNSTSKMPLSSRFANARPMRSRTNRGSDCQVPRATAPTCCAAKSAATRPASAKSSAASRRRPASCRRATASTRVTRWSRRAN